MQLPSGEDLIEGKHKHVTNLPPIGASRRSVDLFWDLWLVDLLPSMKTGHGQSGSLSGSARSAGSSSCCSYQKLLPTIYWSVEQRD